MVVVELVVTRLIPQVLEDPALTAEGQTRSRSPAREVSPKRAKRVITPKRAAQLQLEIAARQQELASLLEANGQEGGTMEPGKNNKINFA